MFPNLKFNFQPQPITRVEEIAPEVFIIYVRRPFDFQSGQVCALKLNEEDELRYYSIATGEQEDELGFLFNIYPGGLLTPELAKSPVGRTLYVSEPTGTFVMPNESATLIATGTGVAPFISTLRSGKVTNKRLIHGARTVETLYGREEFVEALGENYIPCCSKDQGEGIFPGRLTEYLRHNFTLVEDERFYICGSPEMVVTVRDLLLEKGVNFENILSEIYF